MKQLIYIFILVHSFTALCGQEALPSYTFEKVEVLQEEESKPIVVFLHTDWCRYCKRMQKVVFTDPSIQKVLTDKYYYIPFDAEQKETVSFGDNDFKFKPTGLDTGVHEIAEQLGTIDGVLNFPSLVILNTSNEIVFQYGEYLSTQELLQVLNGAID